VRVPGEAELGREVLATRLDPAAPPDQGLVRGDGARVTLLRGHVLASPEHGCARPVLTSAGGATTGGWHDSPPSSFRTQELKTTYAGVT
jgi:hypothetical protein